MARKGGVPKERVLNCLSLAKLEDYLTVRARLARLKGRIINCVAIARDRGSERARKACGAADTRLSLWRPLALHCPRHCSPSGTRSKNYILIHPIEPTAILP
jgi:hypothetical protein